MSPSVVVLLILFTCFYLGGEAITASSMEGMMPVFFDIEFILQQKNICEIHVNV